MHCKDTNNPSFNNVGETKGLLKSGFDFHEVWRCPDL